MTYTYNNKGTCSVRTVVELNDDHTIKSVQILGGCDGNLKGIAKLLPGMKAEDAIARMEGTTCGRSPPVAPTRSPRHSRAHWRRCSKTRKPSPSGGRWPSWRGRMRADFSAASPQTGGAGKLCPHQSASQTASPDGEAF